MTDIKFSAEDIPAFLCLTATNDDMRIECNFCSQGDYVFVTGMHSSICHTDWITRAVTHIQKYHPGGAPE